LSDQVSHPYKTKPNDSSEEKHSDGYFGLGTVEGLSTTFSQFYAKYSDLLVLFGLWKKSCFSIAKRRERYQRTWRHMNIYQYSSDKTNCRYFYIICVLDCQVFLLSDTQLFNWRKGHSDTRKTEGNLCRFRISFWCL